MRIFTKFFYTGLMAGLLFLMGCSLALSESTNKEIVSAKEAAALFAEKKAIIIDVREDSEWDEQHIPGAIHIPLGQLGERLGELKNYQNSPIITQCKSGGRSAKAQETLKSAGFKQVYNLDGGIIAWKQQGLVTE